MNRSYSPMIGLLLSTAILAGCNNPGTVIYTNSDRDGGDFKTDAVTKVETPDDKEPEVDAPKNTDGSHEGSSDDNGDDSRSSDSNGDNSDDGDRKGHR